MSADYSQLELRLMTHFSQEELFLSVLKNGGDLFLSIASKLFQKTETLIQKSEREQCKRICYGILYGIGPKSLSEVLSITVDQANNLLKRFHQIYTRVSGFIQSVIESCRLNGYVSTLSGRKNYFPDIHSNILSDRNAAERQAVNTVCQGSASDLVKTAMINVQKRLNQLHQQFVNRDNSIKGEKLGQLKNMTRLMVQIHDELLFEVPVQYVQFMQRIIREEMENAMPLSVPMVVSIRTGNTWLDVDNSEKKNCLN